ncbi:MAG: hypothetical protein ACJATL_000755 [Rickettsiales bacterium]|jgi:hypothetical protein
MIYAEEHQSRVASDLWSIGEHKANLLTFTQIARLAVNNPHEVLDYLMIAQNKMENVGSEELLRSLEELNNGTNEDRIAGQFLLAVSQKDEKISKPL